MTPEDFGQLEQLAGRLANFGRLGVFSPIRDGERKLFPRAVALPRWRWNLNKPGRRHFDVLLAANVLMYSPDPALWIRHALGACKYLVVLDLVRRRRSPRDEFGADGDRMRYALGDARPRVERYFDLAALGDRLLGAHTFFGGANQYDSEPLHVLALFRGDLADPILRVDDYPTGVRPILSDMAPLHDILRQIEARGLNYRLGIVPALLTDEMIDFLKHLQYMIPVVHGYDHAYPRYAPLLEARGDPYNQRTVGVFNEFKGASYDEVLRKLREGRRFLEERLQKPVDSYIPPCNRGDRQTGRALVEAEYRSYFSEKRIPGCKLSWIRSQFYGRSAEFDPAKKPAVATLHLTWENDLRRAGDQRSLDRMLDALAARQRDERQRGAQLAEFFARIAT